METKYVIIPIAEMITKELGDMPNIMMDTLGGHVFWDTVEESDEYKLQKNKLFGNARILDRQNRRRAWGSLEAMKKKFEIINRSDRLEPGDVIGVSRGLYEHYAVYTGDDRVIHFAGEGKDFGGRISIHEAPMREFLKNCLNFFVLDFPDKYGKPTKIRALESSVFFPQIPNFLQIPDFSKIIKSKYYHLYSPEETVERAKLIAQGMGETINYNLAVANCEHFAIWCKTGIWESHQVNDFLKPLPRLAVNIPGL